MNRLILIAAVLLGGAPDKPHVETVKEGLRLGRLQELRRLASEQDRQKRAIDDAQASLKAVPRDRNWKKRTDDLQARIADLRRQSDATAATVKRVQDPKWTGGLPELDFEGMEVGIVGSLVNEGWRVVDVKPDEFVAVRASIPYLIRGVSTAKLVEGKAVQFSGDFWVADKTSWRGRSVFVLQRFNMADVIDPDETAESQSGDTDPTEKTESPPTTQKRKSPLPVPSKKKTPKPAF